MRMNKCEREELTLLVLQALHEDLNFDSAKIPQAGLESRDITSNSLLNNVQGTASLVAQESAIISGIQAVKLVYKLLGTVKVQVLVEDGQRVRRGTPLVRLKGQIKNILIGERTALNFLQHLSAVATLTNKYVSIASKHKVDILDTRKTIPGYRVLHKYAVRCGGGKNHRKGLYDQILVKSTHVDAVGGIAKTLDTIFDGKIVRPVEIEIRNLDELGKALEYPIDIVLLDNMTVSRAKSALKLLNLHEKVLSELSGGIDLSNLSDYCKLKPNRISVGAITHSAPAIKIHIEHEF